MKKPTMTIRRTEITIETQEIRKVRCLADTHGTPCPYCGRQISEPDRRSDEIEAKVRHLEEDYNGSGERYPPKTTGETT